MSEPRSYDEARAHPQVCACGRLVTRPEYCVRDGCCHMDKHPAATPRPEPTT